MSDEDRRRWDEKYERLGPKSVDAVGLPAVLSPFADLFPSAGNAIDLACGQGLAAVWLALRGLDVWGLDISGVAIDHARALARRTRVQDRCRFDVVDLDRGLPDSPPAAAILCHRFRDRRLDEAIVARLAPDGLLAIVALSEVGHGPGQFRVAPQELPTAFAALDVIATGEGQGQAWLLGRKPR